VLIRSRRHQHFTDRLHRRFGRGHRWRVRVVVQRSAGPVLHLPSPGVRGRSPSRAACPAPSFALPLAAWQQRGEEGYHWGLGGSCTGTPKWEARGTRRRHRGLLWHSFSGDSSFSGRGGLSTGQPLLLGGDPPRRFAGVIGLVGPFPWKPLPKRRFPALGQNLAKESGARALLLHSH
jgi:hypothetical protein